MSIHLLVYIRAPRIQPIYVYDPLSELCSADSCTPTSAVSLTAMAIYTYKMLDSLEKGKLLYKDYATLTGAR